MEGVTGVAELSGDEARENCPTNSFQLLWSTAADLDKLALYPAEVKDKLRELVLRACCASDAGIAEHPHLLRARVPQADPLAEVGPRGTTDLRRPRAVLCSKPGNALRVPMFSPANVR